MAASLLRCTLALIFLAALLVSVVSDEEPERELPPRGDRDAFASSGRGDQQDVRGAGRDHRSGSNAPDSRHQERKCDCARSAEQAEKPSRSERESRHVESRPDREGHGGKPEERAKEDGVAVNFTTKGKFWERNGTVLEGTKAERGRNATGSTRKGNEMQRSGAKELCDCRAKGEKSMSESGTYKAKDVKSATRRCSGRSGAADKRVKKSGPFLQGAAGVDDCGDEGYKGLAIARVLGVASAILVALCGVASLIFLRCCRRPAKTPPTAGIVVCEPVDRKVFTNV